MATIDMDRPGAESHWRLEAHDLRGGFSFATCRAAEGFHSGGSDDAAYFMAAPSFLPEPVTASTVALAATRGGFEHGLFLVDEVEASFESLSAVVEFVRRAYVASSGGDEPDGNEPGSPRPEPPNEPSRDDMEWPSGSPSDETVEFSRQALLQTLYWQAHQIEVATPGQSFDAGEYALGGVASPTSLAKGFLDVFREFLERRPGEGDPYEVIWWEQWQLQGWCINLLGLRPALIEPSTWPHWKPVRVYFDRFVRSAPWVMPLLSAGIHDGFDLIGALPVPRRFMRLLPEGLDRSAATLRHLLVVFVSSPHVVLALSDEEREAVLDLVCFAAACVVAPTRLRRSPWRGPWNTQRDMLPIESAQLAQLVADAMAWLEEHLPTRVYERRLEDRIRSIGNQRSQRYERVA